MTVFSLLLRLLGLEMTASSRLAKIDRDVQRFLAVLSEHGVILAQILETLTATPPAARAVFTVTLDGQVFPEVDSMLLKATQECDVTVAYQDSLGNPAQVQGPPEWATDSPSLLALVVAADGLSAVVRATGSVGTGQVTAKADADLGDGVTEIIGVLDFEVVAGDAAVVVLNAGEAREKSPV
jgi:hypothetical protein